MPRAKNSKPIDEKMKAAIAMSAEGKPYKEIAKELNVSLHAISDWFSRDDVIALRSTSAKRMLQTMQAKAYKVLSNQLDDGNPWIQLSAAREIVRLADQYEQQDQTQVVVSFGAMPSPGSPKSADDEVDAAADETFNNG